MNCEICGLSDKKFYKVEIEGSAFIACSQCAKDSRVISEVTAGDTGESKRAGIREIEHMYGGDIDLDFSRKLRESIKSRDINLEQLSRETKTPVDEIKKVMDGKLIPTIDLARKLEKTLKIKL